MMDNNDENKIIDNKIIPQRYIPFDLGVHVDENVCEKMRKYFLEHQYKVKNIPEVLKSLSKDILFKVEINVAMRLYVFSYGIAVIMLEDDLYPMTEKFAVKYCDYRKEAHQKILDFQYNKISQIIEKIIDDLRSIAQEKKKDIRPSANKNWEKKWAVLCHDCKLYHKKG